MKYAMLKKKAPIGERVLHPAAIFKMLKKPTNLGLTKNASFVGKMVSKYSDFLDSPQDFVHNC